MMWHLRDLEYFTTVATHRGFTRAAEVLFVTQPALSKRIAHLERVTGTSLFVRGRDGVRLTSAGEALLPYARRLLALAGEARRAVGAAAETAAELTVGFWLAPGNGLLRNALARFAREYPATAVSLRRADWTEHAAGVDSGRAEVALLWVPEGYRAPGLRQALLSRELVELAMPSTHPLTAREEVGVEDLREQFLLSVPNTWLPAEPTVDRLDGWGRGVRVVRTIDETVESLLADLGVITVPPSLIAAHMPPSVVARPLRGAPSTDLVAVWRPADEEREEVRALVRSIVRAGQRELASFAVEYTHGDHE